MRAMTTRLIDDTAGRAAVYALRYAYYIEARELDHPAADHALAVLTDQRDGGADQYGTFVGRDLVGCYRIETGMATELRFGADWALADFLADAPARIALVSGLCTRR